MGESEDLKFWGLFSILICTKVKHRWQAEEQNQLKWIWKKRSKTNLSHSSHDQQTTCKGLFSCQLFFLAIVETWSTLGQYEMRCGFTGQETFTRSAESVLTDVWLICSELFTGNWFWFYCFPTIWFTSPFAAA